jgi:hypothetical protein
MSTIKTDTLQNVAGTQSVPVATVAQGSAKAWVNFNGTITSGENRRASFNVSSVVRNGTGDYTVNFTNAMPDANYAAVFGSGFSGASDNALKWAETASPAIYSTTAIRLWNIGTSFGDSSQNSVAIFR